jgi:hypothetical protein
MSNDWYPGVRMAQVALGNTWIEVLALFATKWGVPAAQTSDPATGLIALVAEATGALAESMRSHVHRLKNY